jgi:hypothetical protein
MKERGHLTAKSPDQHKSFIIGCLLYFAVFALNFDQVATAASTAWINTGNGLALFSNSTNWQEGKIL